MLSADVLKSFEFLNPHVLGVLGSRVSAFLCLLDNAVQGNVTYENMYSDNEESIELSKCIFDTHTFHLHMDF